MQYSAKMEARNGALVLVYAGMPDTIVSHTEIELAQHIAARWNACEDALALLDGGIWTGSRDHIREAAASLRRAVNGEG